MRKLLIVLSFVAALLASPALADWTGKDASNATITFKNANTCSSVVCIPIAQPVDNTGAAFGVTANPFFVAPGTGQTFPISAVSLPLPPLAATSISGSTTNPTATLTLPATTTAYTAGQLIANSATAGSVVNPSFAIANSAGGAVISRLRLSTSDTTSTAWGGQTIQVDLWTATPTWTNGDRGAWSPATGTGAHLGAFSCVMSAEFGDGAYAECFPLVGNYVAVHLASGTSIFWSLKAATGSGVTGASKVFTLAAELQN